LPLTQLKRRPLPPFSFVPRILNICRAFPLVPYVECGNFLPWPQLQCCANIWALRMLSWKEWSFPNNAPPSPPQVVTAPFLFPAAFSSVPLNFRFATVGMSCRLSPRLIVFPPAQKTQPGKKTLSFTFFFFLSGLSLTRSVPFFRFDFFQSSSLPPCVSLANFEQTSFPLLSSPGIFPFSPISRIFFTLNFPCLPSVSQLLSLRF